MRIADLVAQQLQQLIQQQAWKGGTRLPAERVLSQQLAVSRGSLREAIQQLSAQGVLHSKRGAGTYVGQPNAPLLPAAAFNPLALLLAQDSDYKYDLLETRCGIEASTAWHAALRATRADKDRIQRCFEVLMRHHRSGQPEASARADAQFHLAIAQASHNVVQLRIMHSMFDLLHSTMTQSRSLFSLLDAHSIDLLAEQHYALVQAIVQGDAPAARTAMEAHLGYVTDNVRQIEAQATQAALLPKNAPQSTPHPRR